MTEQTYTQKIFLENECPWDNPYQGLRPKYLFVCSAGLLRSPTAAAIASRFGVNARACGSDKNYALIPMNPQLIEWADKIVYMGEDNALQVERDYQHDEYYTELLMEKKVVWNIPDRYEYFNPMLIRVLTEKFEEEIVNV